jgi:hypothetical protein
MKYLKLSQFVLLVLLNSSSFSQTVFHTYKLVLIDQDRKPLVGTTIQYELLDQFQTVKKDASLTDSTGSLVVRLPVTLKTPNQDQRSAYSQLYYNIDLAGYFHERGRKFSRYGFGAEDSVVTDTIAFEPTTAHQEYLLSITDLDNRAVNAAIATLTISSGGKSYDTTVTTKKNGQASISIQVQPDDSSYRNRREYNSTLKYQISRTGYYPITGELSSDYGSKYSVDRNPKLEHIRLAQPSNYLKRSFVDSKQGASLKKNILKFIDLIRIQSLLSDALLEYDSIELVNFKGNKYLRIKLLSTNTYNSLKLNNYDIAKRLFDEVIRKVLNPLNTFISDPKLFFGYDLSIEGHAKDFSQDYAITHTVEYRFLLPEFAVRSYKNKDISGQQLLNRSVILLDDERIDLNLQ